MDSDSYKQNECTKILKDCDTKIQEQNSLKSKNGAQGINPDACNIFLPSWVCRIFQICNGEMESFLRQYNACFLPSFGLIIWLLLAFWKD